MIFSLINVSNRRGACVDVNWIQDHIGTLETAKEKARQTEAANSYKITVAVVPKVNSPVPLLDCWTDCVELV
jgi:hypothetical protein